MSTAELYSSFQMAQLQNSSPFTSLSLLYPNPVVPHMVAMGAIVLSDTFKQKVAVATAAITSQGSSLHD